MNNISKTLESKKEKQFLNLIQSKKATGFSFEETKNLAKKKKRLQLIKSGKIIKINKEAENYFQDKLKKLSGKNYSRFCKLKKNDSLRYNLEVSSIIDETSIKREYIENKIGVINKEDLGYIYGAYESIQLRKRKIRLGHLERRLLGNEELSRFLEIFETLSNQSFNKKEFQKYSLSLDQENPLNIFYYLCLRFKNKEGNLGIESTLDPFQLRNKFGKIETRSGISKKYQLEIIKEIIDLTKNQNIVHHILVADFDLKKFGKEGEILIPKAKNYIQNIQNYLGPKIFVKGNKEYFMEKIDDKRYMEIFNSLSNEEGKIMNTIEFNRLLDSNFNRFQKTFNNWTEAKNKEYVLKSVTRNIVEGESFGSNGENNTIVLFNRRIKSGETFNSLSKKNNPVFALPIYFDNKGSIELA